MDRSPAKNGHLPDGAGVPPYAGHVTADQPSYLHPGDETSLIAAEVHETSEPIRYTYGARDICSALPHGDVVDISALPDDLVSKAVDYGDDLHSAAASADLTDTHGVRAIAVRAVTAIAPPHSPAQLMMMTGVLSVLIWVLALAGVPLAWVWAAAAGAPVAVIGTAAGVKRRVGPRPVYSDAEVGQLNDAAVIWPIMSQELDSYPNSAVLQREWDQCTNGGGSAMVEWGAQASGQAALVWREPRLVAVANLIARDIKASPAWASELFDIHRVRIDLDQTLADIQFRAYRIWKAHANLVPPPTTGPDDVIARRNSEIRAAAENAWSTLTELVRQLHDYKQQLAPIDEMVREIAALHLSTTRVTDDAVRQLMVDAAGNTAKAGVVAAATVELGELNANLTARLEYLRQALSEPANVLPITA